MNRRIILTLVILLLLATSFIGVSNPLTSYSKKPIDVQQNTISNSELQAQIWPMFKNDAQHTARTTFDTSNITGVEKWRRQDIEPEVYLFPTLIDNDDTLYVSDGWNFYSMRANGTTRWQREPLGYELFYSLGIGPDGTIYVGSSKRLYAFNPDNTTKWILSTDQQFSSILAFASDSTIYTGTSDGSLYALNPNGTIKWEYNIGSWVISVSLDQSENFYATARYDNHLYCLNPNGTLRWTFLSTQDYFDSPLIADDGNIYITTFDSIYAIAPNGTKKWEVPMDYGESPALAPDGTLVYSPVASPEIYALDPKDGHIYWVYRVAEEVQDKTGVVIGGDGTIYCPYVVKYNSREHGYICALTPSGQLKWTAQFKGNQNSIRICGNPSINADGTIYLTAWYHDGHFYGGLHAFASGPFGVDAGGPYSGIKKEQIFFYGAAWGGTPSYTYHWDFGDGNTSNEISPTHTYTAAGNYTVIFTATDSNGTVLSDNTFVTVDYPPPYISITKPGYGTYFFNVKVWPVPLFWFWFLNEIDKLDSTVIGPLTIKAIAGQEDVGINRVDFYVNGKLKYTDTTPPYEWVWNEHIIGTCCLRVRVFDNLGRFADDTRYVLKI